MSKKKPTGVCPKCNHSISLCVIDRHVASCKGDGPYIQNRRKDGKPSIMPLIAHLDPVDGVWQCDKCSKTHNSAPKMAVHYWRCHSLEDGKPVPNPFDHKTKFHNQFSSGERTTHSKETLEKMSAYCIANPAGVALHPHMRSGSGNSKHYHVKDSFGNDVVLQSSWEYEMSLNLDKNNIKWRRPMTFWLTLKNKCGKQSTYTPDFWLPEYDVYLDPKAQPNKEQSLRIDCWLTQYNKKFLIIWKRDQLTWEYVRDHFGFD